MNFYATHMNFLDAVSAAYKQGVEDAKNGVVREVVEVAVNGLVGYRVAGTFTTTFQGVGPK